MDKIRKCLVVVAVFLLTCAQGYAVPAKPGLITMVQADGTAISVRLIGDENYHFYLTEDDYLLVEDHGNFYYASSGNDGKIFRSDIKATPLAMRSAEATAFLSRVDMAKVRADLQAEAINASKQDRVGVPQRIPSAAQSSGTGLFSYSTFPSTGEQKGLIILVQYADVPFTLENPHDYFSRMVNQEGFDDYGATGSARDFYLECSGGMFSPTFDVYGPVTLPHERAYYGDNGSSRDTNVGQMVLEACTLLDDDIDFTQYDRDGDGVVDNVFLFYAGKGEASGGGAETVWPHSWMLEKALGYIPELDGVKVNRYACTNEWTDNHPDGVGTFIHEFSHVMGLPDLYATSYTGSFTPGSWSTMDYGPYNNEGRTPPLFSAFERYALGWLEPVEIKEPKSAKLNSIGSNEAFIIKCGKDYEYYLLENRQQTGWDSFIPGHGMLIWHIDYVPSVWDSNKVNNTPGHQYVDIEEADGTQDESSRAGDAFPGTDRVTSFTDETTPSMVTWNNLKLGLPITSISESVDGAITFDVAGGRPEVPPVTMNDAKDITPESFTASWSASEHALSYTLTVYSLDDNDEKLYVLDHLNVGMATEWTVEGLSAATTYSYFVTVVDFVGPCTESEIAQTTTLPMSFEYTRPTATDATDVDATSFTATWQALDEADSYILDVYTKKSSEAKSDVCDFTGGIEALPEGWSTNVTSTDSRASYCGQSAPSLRMSADGAYIQSPKYASDIVSLSFWHRGANVPEENSIVVEAKTNGTWQQVTEVPVTNTSGGKTVDIPSLPEGTRSVRITFNRVTASGTLAIDDIDVRWDMSFDNLPVEGFAAKAVGNVTSCLVDGLQPDTGYFYTLTAMSGSRTSRKSDEIKVTTLSSSGIELPTEVSAYFELNGRTLQINLPEGAKASVYDSTGRLVASGQGSFSFTAPSPGIYLISVSGKPGKKIVIR